MNRALNRGKKAIGFYRKPPKKKKNKSAGGSITGKKSKH